jgi:hypothetical protein
VENFQKLEMHLNKKLDEYAGVCHDKEVLPLHAKVLEATRNAHLELKEKEEEVRTSLGNAKNSGNRHKVKKLLLRK